MTSFTYCACLETELLDWKSTKGRDEAGEAVSGDASRAAGEADENTCAALMAPGRPSLSAGRGNNAVRYLQPSIPPPPPPPPPAIRKT
ncbi:hypothetical protein E2C01_082049 [Portunus trituberculatus]|uniref:Uncharacterized protein n=1 Tax=Portunus trituberculatus TaxID=210409 RepID=A0A5B7IY66_PORTR|nr:hypothetical protein [Portunus trituberculatus]